MRDSALKEYRIKAISTHEGNLRRIYNSEFIIIRVFFKENVTPCRATIWRGRSIGFYQAVSLWN